ncbi:hypothetical protein LQW54_002315 [Pestalotiopsis sp. IQ-011]
MPNPMRDEQQQKNGDAEIGREKGRRVPLARKEDREAIEKQERREDGHVDMRRARSNRMNTKQMQGQEMKMALLVRLVSQLKTTLVDVPTLRYARSAKHEQNNTA